MFGVDRTFITPVLSIAGRTTLYELSPRWIHESGSRAYLRRRWRFLRTTVSMPWRCADGTVAVWGSNWRPGQTNIPPGLTNVIGRIAAGNNHCLALKLDGTVVAWGANNLGQTNVPPGLTDVIGIGAGGRCRACAIKGDGTVAAWGSDNPSQLDLPANLTNVVSISASLGRRCGVEGRWFCDHLGSGWILHRPTAQPISSPLPQAQTISWL